MLGLLTKFKVDLSKTKRIADGGLYKYPTQELCNAKSTKRQEARVEVPVWKSVTREEDFKKMLNHKELPWEPRSLRGSAEKTHVISMFKKLFRESRRGIFVSIRNNKMTHWVPFYKDDFRNEALKKLKGFDKLKSDYVIDGCDIKNVRKTEYSFAQYYDLFTKMLRSSSTVADSDFFINLDYFPKIPRGTSKFGVMLLSPCSSEMHDDIPIPTPDEWERITGEFFAMSCYPLKDTSFEKTWSKKRSSTVYRAKVTGGCNTVWQDSGGEYHDTPLQEQSRASLVKFLRTFSGLGVDAGLEGDLSPRMKIKDGSVHLWPEVISGRSEAEYDKVFLNNMSDSLKRSGTRAEQEEIMDTIANSASNFAWWPAVGPVPGGGSGRGGRLAGGKAYRKAMELFWVLNREKVYYEELKNRKKKKASPIKKGTLKPRSPMISSPDPDSPPYIPAAEFGGSKKKAKQRIAKLEAELADWVEKARKEKYYIHGKGAIEAPRNRARPVGGIIAKKGLSGMREFWKKNGVGGSEERDSILRVAKLRGVMSRPLSYEDESKYKFVVVYNDVPGIMEFHMKASMGSLLLVFGERRYHNWFWGELRENVHYMRVDRNNFGERIRWCMRNEEKCREIADNMKKFMKERFTQEKMTQHLAVAADVSDYLSR